MMKESESIEVLYKKQIKYLGSIGVTQLHINDQQEFINEQFDEMERVVKGLPVILVITDKCLRILKENETSVKMIHNYEDVMSCICLPAKRLFAYIARARTSDGRKVIQGHIFKTKRSSHTKNINEKISKVFIMDYSRDTIRRRMKLDLDSNKENSLERRPMEPVRATNIKRKRWAKEEIAKGHQYAFHAQQALNKHSYLVENVDESSQDGNKQEVSNIQQKNQTTILDNNEKEGVKSDRADSNDVKKEHSSLGNMGEAKSRNNDSYPVHGIHPSPPSSDTEQIIDSKAAPANEHDSSSNSIKITVEEDVSTAGQVSNSNTIHDKDLPANETQLTASETKCTELPSDDGDGWLVIDSEQVVNNSFMFLFTSDDQQVYSDYSYEDIVDGVPYTEETFDDSPIVNSISSAKENIEISDQPQMGSKHNTHDDSKEVNNNILPDDDNQMLDPSNIDIDITIENEESGDHHQNDIALLIDEMCDQCCNESKHNSFYDNNNNQRTNGIQPNNDNYITEVQDECDSSFTICEDNSQPKNGILEDRQTIPRTI